MSELRSRTGWMYGLATESCSPVYNRDPDGATVQVTIVETPLGFEPGARVRHRVSGPSTAHTVIGVLPGGWLAIQRQKDSPPWIDLLSDWEPDPATVKRLVEIEGPEEEVAEFLSHAEINVPGVTVREVEP